MNKIARFEALAERLVEGTFARLFAGRLSPLQVATHLTRAIEDQQALSPEGMPQAPTHYWVYLYPEDCEALAVEQPTLEIELARHVTELAAQAGLELHVTPMIQVLPDENMEPHQVHVEARLMSKEPEERTREFKPTVATASQPKAEGGTQEATDEGGITIAPPGRPFLILEGRRHVNLLQATLAIGRALDNDIIIEDPRVSRHHAQLRRRYGRYVLYDLESSGGTQINGYPVEECVLHAGDIISFAGVQVIYSEDPPTPIPLPGVQDTPALPQAEIEPE
jgi:pSer/pThr/pTyr-binding forkhead associated (FHA) protein